jgi:hypothetical protein
MKAQLDHYNFQVAPLKSVICLSHIQFQGTEAIFLRPIPLHKMKALIGCDNIVRDQPTWYKR